MDSRKENQTGITRPQITQEHCRHHLIGIGWWELTRSAELSHRWRISPSISILHLPKASMSPRTRCLVLTAHFVFTVGFIESMATEACIASTLRVVAKSGDIAPGLTTGARFESFPSVFLDDDGNVTIVASLDQPTGGRFREGIWSESFADDLEIIAVEGQALPDLGSEASYYKFGEVHINKRGTIAYTAQLRNGIPGSTGLWVRDDNGLHLIAASGSPAPGLPDGAVFAAFELSNNSPAFAMNSSGDFSLLVAATDIGVGLWTGNVSSGLSLLVHEGQSMPGFPESDVLEMFSFAGIYGTILHIDAKGTTYFHGYTESIPNPTATGPNGLWAATKDGLEIVLREGDVLPGADNSVVTGLFTDGFGSESGILPILARTSNERLSHSSLLLIEDEKITSVLSIRDPAPGGDGLLVSDFFGASQVNDAHQIIFRGEYGNTTAIWSDYRSDSLELVVQELGPAPDVEEGVVFSDSGTSLTSPFRTQVINKNGQIAFWGRLETGVAGVTADNDYGIWASDASGVLRLIVREGQVIEIADGDARTVQAISFGSFNDLGHVAFRAFFTDGTQAAVLSNLVAVPEPSSCLLAAISLVLLLPVMRISCS